MGKKSDLGLIFQKYENPFQSPRANPKHAYHQVNGETQKVLTAHIVDTFLTRKKSLY
ncbi:hypothetical protein JOD45_001763 [Scopulibacillus daqui]|uniref:YpzG-like protein n=1 Tax=Scopulibacillus daqui TaxID=1469162 RepID=A0ABS2PZT3_9BACL|nr:YpzG family protein [Scopulibacillus daqui]MBM7645552.1 hypothetical protein [Scopulibacillus daqui]